MVLVSLVPVFGIGIYLISVLAKYSFLQRQATGDFRFLHVRMRELIDSIAFHGSRGFSNEKIRLQRAFDNVMSLTWQLYFVQTVFALFQKISKHLAHPIAMLLIFLNFQWTHFHASPEEIFGVISTLKV